MGSCQCSQKNDESQQECVQYVDVYQTKRGNLKDYQLKEHLGEGAFGIVWRAIHLASKQVRAIKQISMEKCDEEEKENLINEVNILQQIDHPNIIKIFDFFEDDRNFYIVTELCTGGELFDRISDLGHFSEKEASFVMKQILSALSYCHSSKIIHRDIKPENLLYDSTAKDSQLKIIDFGTSKQTFGKKQKEVIGTLFYMAPELLKEEGYDEKCDIWSAGVVMYILLSGGPPFDGNDDKKIADKIKRGEYQFASRQWVTVSAEAKDLIRKMLEMDPQKRISANQALQDKWITKFSDQKVTAPVLENVLNTMKQFRTQQRLQEATYMYIVKQFATKEDKEELLKTFQALDKNGDGVLSKKELLDGYRKIMAEDDALMQVENIMQQVDKNHSGIIDYSEFVAATINKRKLLSQEKLEAAFSVIDKDNSGSISIDELKEMFNDSAQIPQDTWKQLLKEVDQNGDGQLQLQEFKEMMLKLVIQ